MRCHCFYTAKLINKRCLRLYSTVLSCNSVKGILQVKSKTICDANFQNKPSFAVSYCSVTYYYNIRILHYYKWILVSNVRRWIIVTQTSPTKSKEIHVVASSPEHGEIASKAHFHRINQNFFKKKTFCLRIKSWLMIRCTKTVFICIISS